MIIYIESKSEFINFDNIDRCCRRNQSLLFYKNNMEIKIQKYQSASLAEAALSKIIQAKMANTQIVVI